MSGTLSSFRRASIASTASRERRHARCASRWPILRASLVSGRSISYCTSAVLAVDRAFRRPAPVHHRDPQTAVAQRVRHHRAGDAGADHQHVGLDIALERLVRDGRGAALLPDRASGPQIL